MASVSERDFSLIPEVVWIKIMKQLSLLDRYRLSQTCHTLREHFLHPSVWHTVTIKFTAEGGKVPGMILRRAEDVFLTKKYQQMIEQFGGYFQDLTLVFYGIVMGLTEEHRAVISQLGKTCRLKSLTLEVGIAPSTRNNNDLSMSVDDLECIGLAVTNATRMTSFYLKSWPSFQKVNILNGLVSNEKLKGLETLNILYRCPSETTWSTVTAPIPEIEDILKAIHHFKYLDSLSLRSDLLTTEVVEALAKMGKLKYLQIMVIYLSHTGKRPYEISSQSWSKLKRMCPELQVHFNFVNRVPYIEKAGFMKPEIPVTAVSFMKYSSCTASDVTSISEKYHNTLTKFVNFSDSGDYDKQLVELAIACTKLTHLSTCGPIKQDTVIRIAKIQKDNWKCFQVKKDMVTFESGCRGADSDVIISKTPDGKVVMAQMEQQLASLKFDQNREVREFESQISHILNKKWSLLPVDFMEEDLSDLQNQPRISPSQFAGR